MIKEDALVEQEKKDLWEEANKLQKKRDDLLARNAVVDSENERIQAKFEEQMKDRSILEDNDTNINEKLKSTYEELQQCVDQRQNLRKISSQIDGEHNRLKSLLENMQNETGGPLNDFDILTMKKSFAKLQEDKVSLMQDDLQLERKQQEKDELFQKLKLDREEVVKKLNSGAELWNATMTEFNLLKTRKDEILREESVIETESKQLKRRFDSNAERKEKLMKRHKLSEAESSKVLQEFQSLQSRKFAMEESSSRQRSTQDMLTDQFAQVSHFLSLTAHFLKLFFFLSGFSRQVWLGQGQSAVGREEEVSFDRSNEKMVHINMFIQKYIFISLEYLPNEKDGQQNIFYQSLKT